MSEFERLDLSGLNLTETSIDFAGTILSADYGSGYEDTAVVGLAAREWVLEAAVLPDTDEYLIQGGHGIETRAAYLWNFYVRHMEAGRRPFWVRDQKDGRDYLVKFLDERLTYEVFTAVLYSAGLQLRQRRVRGVESPSDPNVPENNAEI